MAIEKALYQAPEGITEDMMEPAIEIEIEDPESVTIGMGGLEIEISHDEENDKFNENLGGWECRYRSSPPVKDRTKYLV